VVKALATLSLLRRVYFDVSGIFGRYSFSKAWIELSRTLDAGISTTLRVEARDSSPGNNAGSVEERLGVTGDSSEFDDLLARLLWPWPSVDERRTGVGVVGPPGVLVTAEGACSFTPCG
jgi:hypothetical protein